MSVIAMVFFAVAAAAAALYHLVERKSGVALLGWVLAGH